MLFGCVKDQFYVENNGLTRRTSNSNSLPINNINGSWIVVYYNNLENHSIITKNDVDSWKGMDVVLKFADSTFCGQNTTNEVAGHYKLQDSTIKIDVYGGTKMGQPLWGNMFSDNVYSLKSFKVNDTELRFYYNNHKNCVTLYKLRRGITCHWTYSKK